MRYFLFFGMPLALASCANSTTTALGAAAQASEPARPCSRPEFQQMDFWLGKWNVRWDATANQPAGSGTNVVTGEYGNCVIQEKFEGGPTTGNLVGHSVSTYHAGPGRWRQTWVDNQGSYFALVGGPVGDSFVLENTRLSDTAPRLRMVFENIKPNSLTWRWQRSVDGTVWTDSWVIYYERAAQKK